MKDALTDTETSDECITGVVRAYLEVVEEATARFREARLLDLAADERPPELDAIREWRFRSYESFVLAEGRPWISAALPERFTRMREKQCYGNAAVLAVTYPDLRYVEGYAAHGRTGFAVPHAWVVDREDRVVDPTWTDPEQADYFGVVFETREVATVLEEIDPYMSMLQSDYLRDFPILRYGKLFPDGTPMRQGRVIRRVKARIKRKEQP